MGLNVSSLFSRLSELWFTRELRMAMVGLDAAGKTTILHQLKLGEVVVTIPTIGFNVETIEYKNIKCTVWDVGGQEVIRPLWQHYFQNTQALIFVIDSNDPERLDVAKEELMRVMLDDNLRNVHVLIFANKQDLPNAMTMGQISDGLKLNFMGHRRWHIQPCCAVTKDGLYEGFDWLAAQKFEPDTRTRF